MTVNLFSLLSRFPPSALTLFLLPHSSQLSSLQFFFQNWLRVVFSTPRTVPTYYTIGINGLKYDPSIGLILTERFFFRYTFEFRLTVNLFSLLSRFPPSTTSSSSSSSSSVSIVISSVFLSKLIEICIHHAWNCPNVFYNWNGLKYDPMSVLFLLKDSFLRLGAFSALERRENLCFVSLTTWKKISLKFVVEKTVTWSRKLCVFTG